MTATAAASRPTADKRDAILAAALGLIARLGLHGTPMSAIAREAGVAAGTLYLYFPSKDAMINDLYLALRRDRDRALGEAAPAADVTAARNAGDAQNALWRVWHGLARWHLDRPDAANVLLQCQASGILDQATRDADQREQGAQFARFDDAVARGELRPMSRQVFWALFAGPIFVLAQMRDAGEIAVSDEVLRATFDGVCRAVLPPDAFAPR